MASITLDELVDEALSRLLRLGERPKRVIMGVSALTSSPTDTTFTLTDTLGVNVSDVLEFGDELLLVTAKSTAADPVYTASRAYLGTPIGTHATNAEGVVNPPYGRMEVTKWVLRAFSGPLNAYVPYVVSDALFRVTANQYILMPEGTIQVYEVRHFTPVSGRIVDIGGWRFERRMPTAIITTGLALRLPVNILDDDELIVTYQLDWTEAWVGETVELPTGADDLPVLFAVAYGVAGREVSRSELDRIEEWNQEQAIRAGVNLRLLSALWNDFYRRIDEVQRTQFVPRLRIFRKMPKVR